MTHHGAKDKKAVGSTDPDPEHFAGIQMNIKAGPSCCMVRPPAGGGDLSPGPHRKQTYLKEGCGQRLNESVMGRAQRSPGGPKRV